jgi:predicted deoxyguanosinetriphosphate triphosphohydrolase
MCVHSEFWMEWEKKNLAPYAVHSNHVWYGKRSYEDEGELLLDRFGNRSRYKTPFEIDKDRITNSQVFRRLEYKTQVFVTHEGDNFRTRLTHTLEVAELARHIAKALRLNEHLVEAISLGHDLGHAPYGHAAEEEINKWIKNNDIKDYYFCHNRQSLENVEHLEPGYDWDNRDKNNGFGQGINITHAVKEGILVHTNRGYRGEVHYNPCFDADLDDAITRLAKSNRKKGLFYPGSLEAQVVRMADEIAQRIHDLEDGFRSNMINKKHIRSTLKTAFSQFEKDLTKNGISDGDHLIYKNTMISKAFLDDIIKIQFSETDKISKKRKKIYSNIDKSIIKKIDNKIKENPVYRRKFLVAAQVAYLLHMWRNCKYLDNLKREDQLRYKSRIQEYFNFAMRILGDENGRGEYPSYHHIVAFLRGIMLSNIIEHSFWNIHKRIDPQFRSFEQNVLSLIQKPEIKKAVKQNQFFSIFVIVDGWTVLNEAKSSIEFTKADESNRFICFDFKSEQEAREFIKSNFYEIMKSNGLNLSKIKKNRNYSVKKISWLNKSSSPEATEYVRITARKNGSNDFKEIWVPVENLRIYFTGYREMCPGSVNTYCSHAPEGSNTCPRSSSCRFWFDIKRPDINRLIEFEERMARIDSQLEKLITEQIHCGSRVIRMSYMGKKIIRELLDVYMKEPRIMHDRVWSRLRAYDESRFRRLSAKVREWAAKDIIERETEAFPKEAFEELTNRSKAGRFFNNNKYTLVRRIIEYLAGMTDRFIANEYNRVTQSGREVELPDETYFIF